MISRAYSYFVVDINWRFTIISSSAYIWRTFGFNVLWVRRCRPKNQWMLPLKLPSTMTGRSVNHLSVWLLSSILQKSWILAGDYIALHYIADIISVVILRHRQGYDYLPFPQSHLFSRSNTNVEPRSLYSQCYYPWYLNYHLRSFIQLLMLFWN